MTGGGTWEAVGLLDKLPVQVAAAGAAAVFRSIAETTLPQVRSKKPFSAESFGHRHSSLAEADRAAEFPGCLNTGRDRR
ncbi:MAG: hypothetical protein QOJ58_3936 [Alphaproteobacteria bacterium]|jgi:hypothetical protein|nr:hypothetical protein [Alphaproteobacteria bacterium]